ncbi:retrovirus-related pol polyprotein from transposon TNT 1-94 [Tanacetum coccineum]
MIQPIISSASSSKGAWERLLHSYANASRSRIISLNSKLAKNPKGNKSVAEFLNENVLADFERMLKEKDLTSLPIIPTVNVTQRQNSKGTQSQKSFQGHTTGDCRKLAKFLRENNISFVINSQSPNAQLFNAQVGVYQSKVRVSKSSPHINLYTSHKSLALSNVLCVPNIRQNLISNAKLFTSYHFISIDGSPLIDSQHPIPSQTTTQPSTYDSPIPSSTPQAPSSPQQPTDSPSLPPSVTLSPAPATFQEQTPDIFEEEHTPHTFQQHTPNTSDQQHTHSPPVTSQSPGPHATTSQPPQTQSNLQRPTHEKKRNPKCFNEKYVNTARNNTKFLDEFVNNLSIKFSIKDLGTSHQFLGVEVISTPSRLFLSQHQHIADLLSRFNMAGAKEVSTPQIDSSSYRSIVGSLQYLAITRPDVSFAVNKLSQFMHAPTQLHLQALKRVLRYLKGTIHHELFLNRKSAITLTAFSDSNWGGIKDNGRSTTAYILYLGSNIISWRSARQKSVSRSSTEAEYKALANASAEMMWVQNLLHELGMSLHETPTLFCDNTCATYLCVNPVYHSCMKHVAHFVRERVSEGSLRVLHISSKDQLVDMLTKPLGRS